uniref:ATP synthase F0 subunit 8 n=1 Tax=Pareas formosensis TaxID=1008428 RepID=A0A8A0Y5Z5_9SAUR|nr:ATP synthase F0 subunit 8 [Pareas formosensis]QSQ87107.1 ATP synthase F0 subunit 8 [Pareas formosensis]
MPQLNIIYVFMTYLWTWFILYSITQKIKTYQITMTPLNNATKMGPPMMNLPWT